MSSRRILPRFVDTTMQQASMSRLCMRRATTVVGGPVVEFSTAASYEQCPRSNVLSRRNVARTMTTTTTSTFQPRLLSSILYPLTKYYTIINSHHCFYPDIPSSKMSTAVMSQESSQQPHPLPPTKRKPMSKRRDPLIITPAAAKRIADLVNSHNNIGGGSSGNAVGIRLGTKKRGCNGLSYTLNYAYENHTVEFPRDEKMTIDINYDRTNNSNDNDESSGNGLLVFVEPMALMNIIGTTMDYEDDEMSSEFTFTNPNSKGECGCGESFNV